MTEKRDTPDAKASRETVGKISTDLLRKAEPISPIEQMRESLTEYEKNINECLETGKKTFPKDFFIVVITKKEPLMPNVIRNYFFPRLSCPTPDYDQTVYKYSLKNDHIEFLWVIPSRDTCFLLVDNRHEVAPAEYALLQFVLKFHDGTLFKIAKSLNNEESLTSPFLEN